MLKKVSVIVMVLILSACTSQPVDKRFKGAGDFDKVEAAKTRVSLGLTYLKNGNFSQAKFNLDKALDFDPRSGQANFAMAFYYQQVDEVKRAHEYYKQAIDFSDDDPDVLNSYGAFLCKQGDYGQAKRYFLKAVDDKRYVSTAGTYENLAICAESQGLIEEAIAYFNSALNHQPTRASSLLYLSQLYVKTKQWDAAKKTVWKYERNSNVSAESLWLSFQISQGQQNLREAVEFAEILKRLYPSNANTKKAVASLGKFQPDMAVTQKTKPTVINKEPLVSITMADIESSNTAAAANASRSPYKVDKPPVPQATQTEMPAQPATANVEAVGAKVKNIEVAISEADDNTELALQTALDNLDLEPGNEEPIKEISGATINDTPMAQTAIADALIDDVLVDVALVDDPLVDDTPAVDTLIDDELVDEAPVEDTLVVDTLVDNTPTDDTLIEMLDDAGDIVNNAQTPFHTVQPKENLYRISLKYNVKIKKLLEWNNLENESSIRIGTKLWLRDPNSNE